MAWDSESNVPLNEERPTQELFLSRELKIDEIALTLTPEATIVKKIAWELPSENPACCKKDFPDTISFAASATKLNIARRPLITSLSSVNPKNFLFCNNILFVGLGSSLLMRMTLSFVQVREQIVAFAGKNFKLVESVMKTINVIAAKFIMYILFHLLF